MRGYKTDKRRARPAFYSDGTCPRTSKHRLSIPRVRLIALNRISPANAPGIAACAAYRVTVVKDFIVMNLIFIQTVPAACSLSLSLPLPLPLPLSLSLSVSVSVSVSSCPGDTRRTERYVPMQTWFAGYLERNKGGELSSAAPYPGAGYP